MARRVESRSELVFALSCFLLTLLLLLAASYLTISDPLFRVMMRLSLQAELLSYRYVGDLSPDAVFASAWNGMQRAIPFPVSLTRTGAPIGLRRQLDFGVKLIFHRGRTTVYSVKFDSPVVELLRPGDVLTRIGDSQSPLPIGLEEYFSESGDDSLMVFFERQEAPDSVLLGPVFESGETPLQVDTIEDCIYLTFEKLEFGLPERIATRLSQLTGPETRGLILDLRNSSGGSNEEALALAALLGEGEAPLAGDAHSALLAQLPLAVLIDASTTNESELLAGLLVDCGRATAVGRRTRGFAFDRQAIELWSGDSLYLSSDRSRGTPPNQADSADSAGTSFAQRMLEYLTPLAIKPQVVIKSEPSPSLVVDLKEQGLIFEFVLACNYRTLPDRDQEASLLADFFNYLRRRDYRYDPLRQELELMSANDLRPEQRRAVNRLIRTERSLDYADPLRYTEELTRELLQMIWDVKVARQPDARERLRLSDRSLARALILLHEPGA